MRPPRPGFWPFSSLALALSGACVLAGCASVPAGIQDAGDLRITYMDFKTGHEMILVNESNPAYEGLYSKARPNANTKVAPDEVLHDLIDFAAGKGFFDYAETVEPDQVQHTAFRVIAISADGETYSFVVRPGRFAENPAAADAFNEIQMRLVADYNSIHQLQYVDTKRGGSFFEKEQERLRQENLERMTGKGGNR